MSGFFCARQNLEKRVSKTTEQLEQEADAVWAKHFGPAGDKPADTPVTEPTAEASPPAEANPPLDAADTTPPEDQSVSPEAGHDGEGVRWEERYKNAQALMTRATQEAARVRIELAEAQRQQAAMLAEIQRLRADGASPNVPPAAQAVQQSGARQDTAQAELDEKLKRVMNEDPELAGPLIEQAQSVRRDLDQMRLELRQRDEADAKAAHMARIRAAHPDFETIGRSPDFEGWVARMPDVVKQVISAGSAEDVIWVLSHYKQASGIDTNLEAARAAATPNTPRVRRVPIQDRPRFTRAQIASMAQNLDVYRAHEREIDEAMAAGLIA